MEEILMARFEDVPSKHISEHDGYEYYKREFVSKSDGHQCAISVYEIPPGKSAYPYHYHVKNEEAFYIISGIGILKTPTGDKEITAGDFLFFPANEKGAHKLINTSETEMLIYLDFDTHNEIDAAFYPDSNKIGIWGKSINQIYKTNQQVTYYDGE
jgi:uncharacterized cupin superfamily protein